MKWVFRLGLAAWAVCFALFCGAAFGLFLGMVAAACTALISDGDAFVAGYRVARYACLVFTIITAPACVFWALRCTWEFNLHVKGRPRRRFRL